METQRIVLIIGLAIVSYLLVLQWNEDYGQPVSNASQPAEISQVAEPSSNVAGTDLPSSLPSNNEIPAASISSEDVPSAEPLTPVNPGVFNNSSNVGSGSNLISVETDVLSLRIDPKGGDIVYAALKKYPISLEQPDVPFVMFNRVAGYQYVSQTGLIGRDGPDAAQKGRPQYQSKQQSYLLSEGDSDLSVDLVWEDAGVQIIKRYGFTPGSYQIDVSFEIINNREESWQGGLFGQLKRDNSDDPSQGVAMGMQSYLGIATTTKDEKYKKLDFDDIQESPFRNTQTGGWISIIQHYFLSAWIPNPEQTHSYQTRVNSQNQNIAGFVSPAVNVAAGETGRVNATLYVGPKDQAVLEQLSPHLELTVDYGWLWFIAQPLFWLLSFLHGLVGNWGVAIILTTLVIKLVFFKLSATSYRSMANMRKLGPEMQRLKELYGDDRQKMSVKVMEMYKKEKINPLGGCLPILVQMPVFIALYWVLLESVELRQAPFMLWIQDLAVMDPYFVLPILMGATMIFQQTLNPEPPDPMQAKVMKIMPVMFTFFFLWFPAGLVLYWLVNNILSIAQQWVITKQIEQGTN